MITAALDGVWTPVWQQQCLLDDELAKRRGHLTTSLAAAPHGTFVPMECFRVQTTDSDDGQVENAIIDIYDSHGNFIRFRWDENAGRWNSSDEPITYTIPAGKYGLDQTTFPELTLTRYPSLALAQYTKDDTTHPDYVNRYHPKSLGDPNAAVTLPPQGLDYKGEENHLEWKIEPWASGGPLLILRLGYPPLDPSRYKPGHNLGQTFGQAFITQSKLDQVSVSFCGFEPSTAGSYASKGLYSGTSLGTSPQDTHSQNPGQIFEGALLFAFPRQDSYDYVQCTYIEGSPNVPVGIWPRSVNVEQDDTHSQLVSSSADQAQAYAVSYGFSAGIEKMLSLKQTLSYSGKTDTQNKNQSRFTVSRKVEEVWAAHLDIPSLVLHETYLAGIKQRTYDLLSDTTPDKSQTIGWDDDFVPTWGTHYANSITHGRITLGQTWFSLHDEKTMAESKKSLAQSASATLEGVKAGADYTLTQEWKTVAGLELSEEDTSHFGIGTPDPVSIFLDLRPASELMSPIFLPYNDKDEWGKFAPWVWTEVRSNFEEWLTKQGLNQPIDQDLVEDYRPRTFTITFPSLVIEQGPFMVPNQGETLASFPYVTGTISISPLPDSATATPGGLDPSQSLLYQANGATMNKANLDPESGQVPIGNTLGCTIATTAGNVKAGAKGGLCFALTFDLLVTVDEDLYGGHLGSVKSIQNVPQAHFQATGMVVEIPFADVPNGQAQAPTKTIDVSNSFLEHGWQMHLTVVATDAGPFEN
ncbi:hypothetical protein [Phycicoccus elongatus]|uniref:hypothetical protein n=1 Tax=Phycicoccus elongatus TaxID=101689 RepID=UPI003784A012